MQGDGEVTDQKWNLPADPADLKLPAALTADSSNDGEDGRESDGAVHTHQTHVKRGLKQRHIQLIALGGTIGTGLFLGIGKHLAQSGPLSTFLGYIFTGCAVWGMMQCVRPFARSHSAVMKARMGWDD